MKIKEPIKKKWKNFKDLNTEYWFKKESARFYSKLELMTVLIITYYHGLFVALIVLGIAIPLDFITWYKKIRSGDLEKKAEKTGKRMGGV